MKGLKFNLSKWKFCINTRGIDISNGIKGSFIFHPTNKNFSFKQYYYAYKWLLTDEIKQGLKK